MILKPTSKEYKDKYYNYNCWNWRTSGIHSFNVLFREEQQKKKEMVKNENNNSKFKDWIK